MKKPDIHEITRRISWFLDFHFGCSCEPEPFPVYIPQDVTVVTTKQTAVTRVLQPARLWIIGGKTDL
jgi:hypothetical protein